MALSSQAEKLKALLQARAKGSPDKPARLPQPQPVSPARAAASALGRAAERLYRLPALPLDVQVGAITPAELPELLPEQALLVVLQGPGDLIGMMAISFEAVTALIEVQALGRVTARPAERRRLTRSDAAICMDFVNAAMGELGLEMAGIEGFGPIQGYRYATQLDDHRPLLLMLDDRPLRSLSLQVRLGSGETRDGSILIAVPHAADALPAPVRAASDPASPALPARAGASLAGTVAEAPVDVVGVLCRRTITLGELRALVPGRLLPLPRVNLAEARLETRDGQLLAVGKLGEAEGCHALRLRDPAQAADAHIAPIMPAATPPADLLDRDPFRVPGASDGAGEGAVARWTGRT